MINFVFRVLNDNIVSLDNYMTILYVVMYKIQVNGTQMFPAIMMNNFFKQCFINTNY